MVPDRVYKFQMILQSVNMYVRPAQIDGITIGLFC